MHATNGSGSTEGPRSACCGISELPQHLSDMGQFSVATGLRQASVTSLQWKQISLERRHLWVCATDHKMAPLILYRSIRPPWTCWNGGGEITQTMFSLTKATQSSKSTPRLGSMRCNGPGFKISGGMICGTHLPPGAGRLELPRTNCNGWVGGKHNPWWSDMLT